MRQKLIFLDNILTISIVRTGQWKKSRQLATLMTAVLYFVKAVIHDLVLCELIFDSVHMGYRN